MHTLQITNHVQKVSSSVKKKYNFEILTLVPTFRDFSCYTVRGPAELAGLETGFSRVGAHLESLQCCSIVDSRGVVIS